jgi:hypothetical protein
MLAGPAADSRFITDMLRIGFDMDGVLADFERAFHDVERRLFGAGTPVTPEEPEKEEEARSSGLDAADAEAITPRHLRRRHDAVWDAIQSTPNFWESLAPTETGAVRRIHDLMVKHRWEVFFITQRPATDGDTVQRQTQRWLVGQGFDLPSVLVIGGSRGPAAGALRLNYHVDDSAQNCIDVLSDSDARPILVVSNATTDIVGAARKLGVGTAASIGECLDILERASEARSQPGLLRRLAAAVGWK